MSQAFDFLNTGNTGVTFGNEETTDLKQELVSEQAQQAQELLPSVKAILATLDAEIAAIADIRAYMKSLGPKPSASVVTQEYRARELYIEMIERLKLNIGNKVADYEAGNDWRSRRSSGRRYADD